MKFHGKSYRNSSELGKNNETIGSMKLDHKVSWACCRNNCFDRWHMVDIELTKKMGRIQILNSFVLISCESTFWIIC